MISACLVKSGLCILASDGLDLDSAGMQYEEISSEEESMEGELDLELLGVGGDKKKKKSELNPYKILTWISFLN